VWLAGTALVVVSFLAVLGLWLGKRRALEREAARRGEEVDRGPVVTVARAEAGPATRALSLTADVRGLYQTTLYAKVSGYVRDIRVDKGDRVKKGDALGSVESPETDQALEGAIASAILQRKLAARARVLAPDIVPQQDLETATSNLDVSSASLVGARALQRYEIIRAPFDGVVTARYVDPGALLPAATGGTQAALPFVDVGTTDILRVDAFVGQDVAPFVHPGDPVVVWQDERPDVRVPTSITRTAGALDPRTRTMLVEVEMDNRAYGLLPGTFAHFDLRVTAPPLPTVPAEALVVRGGRNLVGRVEGERVHLVPIEPGPTNGKTLEVRTGIREGDVVALDLPVDVADGAALQPVEKKVAPRDGGAGGR
jgi:RND family efflux transporter MFP subunit